MTSESTVRDGRAYLRGDYGWPVTVRDGQYVLLATSGFCGVSVSKPLGERMRRTLDRVGSVGPIIGARYPLHRYVFLAEPDTVIDPDEFAGRGAALLHGSCDIALPPSCTAGGSRYWVVAPDPVRRWLPNLSTVLWALFGLQTPTTRSARRDPGYSENH
ncbi:hypothetical protein ACFWXT_29450 [Bacillus cereus]|uniref:hypothetical protein n=1 Tax=Bacillus cereus TaxID=1396 RepID=UPI00366B6857